MLRAWFSLPRKEKLAWSSQRMDTQDASRVSVSWRTVGGRTHREVSAPLPAREKLPATKACVAKSPVGTGTGTPSWVKQKSSCSYQGVLPHPWGEGGPGCLLFTLSSGRIIAAPQEESCFCLRVCLKRETQTKPNSQRDRD